jgi:hypothetical protein
MVPSSVLRRGCLILFVMLFLCGTRRLRQFRRAPRSSGGVVLVAIFVVLDDLAWSLLPGINVSVSRSSSRVSDSDRWCGALRSRVRGAGAPLWLRRWNTTFCPWSMCGLILKTTSFLQVAISVVVLVRLRLVDDDFGAQAVCLVYFLIACVRWRLVS